MRRARLRDRSVQSSAGDGFSRTSPHLASTRREEELSQLYARYAFAIHRRCVQLLRNCADADDALQEVFLRVQRYRHTRTGFSTLAWLQAIAFNCCWDLQKHRRRERPVDHQALYRLDCGAQACSADPDTRALVAVILRKVESGIREIGILHHLNGLTQDEVASEKGYSRRTIGKKLQTFDELFKSYWVAAGGAE